MERKEFGCVGREEYDTKGDGRKTKWLLAGKGGRVGGACLFFCLRECFLVDWLVLGFFELASGCELIVLSSSCVLWGY